MYVHDDNKWMVLKKSCFHRCENGDLGGKHGQLTISPIGLSRSTAAFIDTNLQLNGAYQSKSDHHTISCLVVSKIYIHLLNMYRVYVNIYESIGALIMSTT